MNKRKVKFKPEANVESCPDCGNKSEFTIFSDRASEDYCDVWAQCKCGYQSDSSYFFEDVWGGTHDANVFAAIDCWNTAVFDVKKRGDKVVGHA